MVGQMIQNGNRGCNNEKIILHQGADMQLGEKPFLLLEYTIPWNRNRHTSKVLSLDQDFNHISLDDRSNQGPAPLSVDIPSREHGIPLTHRSNWGEQSRSPFSPASYLHLWAWPTEAQLMRDPWTSSKLQTVSKIRGKKNTITVLPDWKYE